MFRIKYSRETILKLLYLVDVLPDDNDAYSSPAKLLADNAGFFKGLNNLEKNFITKVINKTMTGKKEIDQLISENLIGWKLERLMAVDRSLLRMGIAEADFNDQKAVVIDDVIRIAKKYGGEESYKIINAILDKILK